MRTRILTILGIIIQTGTHSLHAQGTAFTYQGRLNDGTSVATGSYDLTFTLFSVSNGVGQVGSPLTNAATAVSNGLFAVTLDFGNQFPGAPRWLEIGVRSNSVGTFQTLTPRQPLTPAPYAIYAESANATNLVGTVQSANLSGVALLNGGNAFTGQQTVTGGSVGIGTTSPAKTLDVTGSASGVASGGSIDPSVFVRLNNSAADGNSSSSDLAGIGFGHNSTRQAIVGGTFGNDFLDFYTGGLLTSPKMRIDIDGGVTLSDPRVGAFGSGAIINLSDSFSGSVESSAIGSVGNGGGFTWRNGALELRPVSRLNIYKGSDVTSAGTVALTMVGSSGNVGIGTTTPANTLDVQGSADFSGNVGIGTTTPRHKLDVNGNIFLGTQRNGQIFNEIGDTLYLGAEQKYLGNTLLSPAGGSTDWINLMANPLSAGIMFGLAGPTTTNPHTNTTPLMVIKPNGNVGIGTTTPAKQLDVTGNAAGVLATDSVDPSIFLRVNNTANDGGVGFRTDVAGIGFGRDSTRQAIVGGTFGSDYLDFYTGGLLTAPKMRIDFNGKVGIGTTSPSQALHVIGNILASGTITGSSDRNVKTNFASVNPRDVLDKVAGLPITRWNYDADLDVAHIGPMAQDFFAAFNVGMDDKHISMVDADGVALAAIQGLNQKLEETRAENAKLRQQNDSLATRLNELEAAMKTLAERK
jgi:trimeric autotransporter adhesin